MTEAFTPGPWQEACESGDWFIAAFVDEPQDIKVVCDSNNISEANVRLICAAPDLLAELAEIVDGWTTIERNQVRGRRLTAWEQERLQFARKALAKARGE